jgi:hypothetical protein
MRRISIARIVLYVLSQQDAEVINARRQAANQNADEDGCQLHLGNHAEPGDILPAIAVKVWDQGDTSNPNPPVNFQVFLDGGDTYWATSRHEDQHKTPGTWHWPEVPFILPSGSGSPLPHLTGGVQRAPIEVVLPPADERPVHIVAQFRGNFLYARHTGDSTGGKVLHMGGREKAEAFTREEAEKHLARVREIHPEAQLVPVPEPAPEQQEQGGEKGDGLDHIEQDEEAHSDDATADEKETGGEENGAKESAPGAKTAPVPTVAAAAA